MGCSSSSDVTRTWTRTFASPCSTRPKTLLRAYEIPITSVIGPADQLGLEETDAWEKCSVTSWDKREMHVVGDKIVPLPTSFRTHQKHKGQLEKFLELEVIGHDEFKERVAERRSKLDAKLYEQQYMSDVSTSIDSASSSESPTSFQNEPTLPGYLEF